jgi:hypothetical protein
MSVDKDELHPLNDRTSKKSNPTNGIREVRIDRIRIITKESSP